MHKTTVYLNDDELDAVRQLAVSTGLSQAEVIRDAIRQVAARVPPRRFRSLGLGEATNNTAPRWNAGDLYTRTFGGR